MRSQEWMDEFGHHQDSLDSGTWELVLDGSIEICPKCGELSAYAWGDCDDYEHIPERGQIGHIGTCGGDEWECGHCKTPWMDRDSPLNHPAYTHEEDV